VTEYRPSCGGGSCAACLGALGLDAVKHEGAWYCTPSCAQGLGPAADTQTVADPALYHRPRRFYRKRSPKELQGGIH
jgi:hypothetical protein